MKISYHESALFIQDDFKIGRTFSLLTEWTIQQSQLSEPEPNFNSREFFRTPNSYGYFSLRYENNKLANVYLSAEYTGSMKAPHYAGYIDEDRLEITQPFCVVNLRLRKPIAITENYKVSLFIDCYNLLNSYQEDLDKGLDRDSGYGYGPAKPRSFYAGFEFSF